MLQVLMSWQLADALQMPCKCYSACILVQFMYVHGAHALGGGGGSMTKCFRKNINFFVKEIKRFGNGILIF